MVTLPNSLSVADGQLEVMGDNVNLLIVAGRNASQLQYFHNHVLEHHPM